MGLKHYSESFLRKKLVLAVHGQEGGLNTQLRCKSLHQIPTRMGHTIGQMPKATWTRMIAIGFGQLMYKQCSFKTQCQNLKGMLLHGCLPGRKTCIM